MAVNDANPSLTGNAAHAPFSSKNGGSIRIDGIKKINCRVRLKKIDKRAFPID